MTVPEDAPSPAGGRCIETVAIIGAGEQGRAFALRCARAGFTTVLEDVMPARLRQAHAEFTRLTGEDAASRLRLALTVEEAVREADLAIDFVPDELESKLEIFSLMDRMAPPKTILCTPTQTLSISDLASCTYRADRCIALHGQGSNLATNRLSLLLGHRTDPTAGTRVAAFLRALGVEVTLSPEPAGTAGERR